MLSKNDNKEARWLSNGSQSICLARRLRLRTNMLSARASRLRLRFCQHPPKWEIDGKETPKPGGLNSEVCKQLHEGRDLRYMLSSGAL